LSGVDNGAWDNDWFFSDEAFVRSDERAVKKTGGILVNISLKSQFQVSWGDIDKVGLVFNVDSDKTLSIWNGNGWNREACRFYK